MLGIGKGYGQIGLTEWVVARGMDNDVGYAGVKLSRRCSKALRRHHAEGQGTFVKHVKVVGS